MKTGGVLAVTVTVSVLVVNPQLSEHFMSIVCTGFVAASKASSKWIS